VRYLIIISMLNLCSCSEKNKNRHERSVKGSTNVEKATPETSGCGLFDPAPPTINITIKEIKNDSKLAKDVVRVQVFRKNENLLLREFDTSKTISQEKSCEWIERSTSAHIKCFFEYDEVYPDVVAQVSIPNDKVIEAEIETNVYCSFSFYSAKIISITPDEFSGGYTEVPST
jgi:hypothetical protein